MLIDVISAEHNGGYNIMLTFENGEKGMVDFTEYTKKGGVFNILNDIDYFLKFYVNKELGTICWPNGLDIAPDTLYEKMKKFAC